MSKPDLRRTRLALRVAAGCFFAVSGVVIAFLAWLLFPFEPVTYEVPQAVEREAYAPGESVVAHGTKCNTTTHEVPVQGRVYLSLLSTDRPKVTYELFRGGAGMAPGCISRSWSNKIPHDAPPGRYRIEGFETIEGRLGLRTFVGHWYTADFSIEEEAGDR